MRPRQTSHTPKKRHKNRILWLSTTMLVLFVVSVFGLKASIPVALAMEQQTRCGLEEHVHDEDCYINNVITCQQKAHSHSNNCYLLLLEDNDVNMLLTAVSQSEDKNLESLITGVLGEAVRLNDMSVDEELVDISDSAVPLSSAENVFDSAVMTASFSGTTYAGTEVSQLNNIIDAFALEPAVVLNEGMAVPMSLEEESVEATLTEEPVVMFTASNRNNTTLASEGDIATVADSYIIRYTVNFPDSSIQDTIPYISGTTSRDQSYTYDVDAGEVVIKDVTARVVKGDMTRNNWSNNGSKVAYFTGWKIAGTDVILSPNAVLSESELSTYIDMYGSNSTLTLQGAWEYDVKNSVAFYINRESEAPDFSGNVGVYNPGDYSAEMFNTYVGGIDTARTDDAYYKSFNMVDENPDNSYTVDQTIRSKVGQREEGIWFYSFPTDEYVFDFIKQEINNSSWWNPAEYYIDGEQITKDDLDTLDSDHYAIRWYVFKAPEKSGSNSSLVFNNDQGVWHIDGRLVKKVAKFNVEKTFSGNEAILNKNGLKDDFYILATNSAKSRKIVLYLAENGQPNLGTGYTYLASMNEGDNNPNTYKWQISDVEYDELWNFQECTRDSLMQRLNVIEHTEYHIRDASGKNANITGTGKGATAATEQGAVTARGVTLATDLPGEPEWVTVGFNNIYYQKDTLMLKKEDKKTGNALNGAIFEIYQKQEDGTEKLMYFTYDTASGLYRFTDSTAAISRLTFNGYLNIAIQGFSYGTGDLVVREIEAPNGYKKEHNPIIIGYTDSSGSQDVDIKNEEDCGHYTIYHDGLLVVQNSSDPISVTVNKIWDKNCSAIEKAQEVMFRLLANGSVEMASVLADGQPVQIILSQEKGLSYTWTDLPIVSDNKTVEWTVQEIKIGAEDLQKDGSFLNWTPVYAAASYDQYGNVKLDVTNTPKRCFLYLYKTDWEGLNLLKDAVFELIEVGSNGNPISGAIPKKATTNENGVVLFDNLKYATRYKLIEETAPAGYWALGEENPIFVIISSNGTVTATDTDGNSHEYVSGGAGQSITVKNRSSMPMPETGGRGTLLFTGVGMLIAFSVFTYQKKNARRKRRRGARRTSR